MRYPTWVTAVLDKNDVTRWTVTYDGSGRATVSSGPSGVDSTTVVYSADGASFSRTLTNALGKNTVFNFTRGWNSATDNNYDVKLTGTTGQVSANCSSSATGLTYDANRFVATTTDEEGRVTQYTRDTRGRSIQTIEAYGTTSARTTGTTWNTTWNLPSQIVAPGRTTDFVYDTAGRLLTKTETDTTSFATPYVTNGRTRTWTYTWSTSGQLLTVDGPLAGAGDKVTYTYNATNGYLGSKPNHALDVSGQIMIPTL